MQLIDKPSVTKLKRSIVTIIVCLSFLLSFQSNSLATTKSADDIFFKKLTDASYAAWNSQNPDKVAEFFQNSPDLVVYDALPLKYSGWEEFKTGIKTNLFDKLDRFQLTANDDLHATRIDDLVWTTFTYHLSAKTNSGEKIEAEGRQTDLWQERDSKWVIIHEHTSTPASI